MCVFLCSCHLIIYVGFELNKCLCFSLTDLITKNMFIFLIHFAHPDRHSFQFVLSWLNGYNNHHVLNTYSDNYKWFLSTLYPLHDNVLTFIIWVWWANINAWKRYPVLYFPSVLCDGHIWTSLLVLPSK